MGEVLYPNFSRENVRGYGVRRHAPRLEDVGLAKRLIFGLFLAPYIRMGADAREQAWKALEADAFNRFEASRPRATREHLSWAPPAAETLDIGEFLLSLTPSVWNIIVATRQAGHRNADLYDIDVVAHRLKEFDLQQAVPPPQDYSVAIE